MKYLDGSFSVNLGESQAYRDNWDRTFGKKKTEKTEEKKSNCAKCSEGCACATDNLVEEKTGC